MVFAGCEMICYQRSSSASFFLLPLQAVLAIKKNYATFLTLSLKWKTFFPFQRTHCRRCVSTSGIRIYCTFIEKRRKKRLEKRQEQKSPINVTDNTTRRWETFFNYDGHASGKSSLRYGFVFDLIFVWKTHWTKSASTKLESISEILSESKTFEWCPGEGLGGDNYEQYYLLIFRGGKQRTSETRRDKFNKHSMAADVEHF